MGNGVNISIGSSLYLDYLFLCRGYIQYIYTFDVDVGRKRLEWMMERMEAGENLLTGSQVCNYGERGQYVYW